jgi:hypothetical protein
MNTILRISTAVALALVAPLAFAGPDRTGTCVHANVTGTVLLPDGDTAVDPDLKLCYAERFSPVAGLHEAYVDGMPIGRFTSVRGISEGTAPAAAALIVLRRGPDDLLTLHAYAVRAGDRMVTYRFGARADPRPAVDVRWTTDDGAYDIGSLIADRPEEYAIVAALP